MGRRAAFQVGSVQGALRGGENSGFYLIGRRDEGRMMCNDTGKANGSEAVVIWTGSGSGVKDDGELGCGMCRGELTAPVGSNPGQPGNSRALGFPRTMTQGLQAVDPGCAYPGLLHVKGVAASKGQA
jgi:hypothetical protein